MPIPKCQKGFDCSLMMFSPGLSPEDCENKDNCRLIYEDSQEELAEIDRLEQIKEDKSLSFICKNSSLILNLSEILRTNYQAQEACHYFLAFDNYQSYLLSRKALIPAADEFDFIKLSRLIDTLNSDISNLMTENNFIITPVLSELSSCQATSPIASFLYWQLSADQPIFKSAFPPNKGKKMYPYKRSDMSTQIIHLGKEGSFKHFLVANFINNRNKIQKALNKLKNALTLIQEALEILSSIE